ncbi:MAG: hypothetical protein QXI85_08075 [Desulfurococcaceae archaeon]
MEGSRLKSWDTNFRLEMARYAVESDPAQLRRRLAELDSKMRKAVGEVGELKAKIDALSEERRKLREDIARLEAELRELKGRMAAVREEGGVDVKKLWEERRSLQERVTSLRREIRELLDRIDRGEPRQEELRSKMREYAALESRLKAVEASINEASRRRLEERTEREKLKLRIAELQEELVRLRRRRAALKKQLEQLKSTYAAKASELQDLRQEIERIRLFIRAAEIAERLRGGKQK